MREHFGVLAFFFFARLQIFRLCSTRKTTNKRMVQHMEKNLEQNGFTCELRGEQCSPLLELPERNVVFMWRVYAALLFKQIAQIFEKTENRACSPVTERKKRYILPFFLHL
ncbi:MAG: hypothetical protein IKT43_02680 [Clostridia bacterium]|nr:hypothetical protein [Clostridia bacterium]